MKFAAGFIWALTLFGANPPTPQQREQITTELGKLSARIDGLRARGVGDERIADIEVYKKAADWILRFEEEFYTPDYVANTLRAIDHGLARAADAKFSWESAKGRIVRGYRSRVDGSVQPYALVIPDSYDGTKPVRLDVILHGRGATLNEVSFIAAHEGSRPIPAAQDFIQLEVFGRGNNAYRWAGETDVFEALDAVKAHYKIDEGRIVLRGFSMGGAGAWHLGLHYPDKWAAVEAGAGFTETRRYAKLTDFPRQQESLLRIYDSVEYAANARMVPMVGYGGERDPQLQASINIRERLASEFMTPPRILFLTGPDTEHKWHPDSLAQSNRFIEDVLRQPRMVPDHVQFVTYTTAYSKCYWVTIESLGRQYQRAEVDAIRTGDEAQVTTKNVTRLRLDGIKRAVIDGDKIETVGFGVMMLVDGKWRVSGDLKKRKRPGLQGPIDDAFRDAFLCVLPTGKPANRWAGAYVNKLIDQFRDEWAKWMRGDLRVKKDTDVTADDATRYHLIAFGDLSSNKVIREIGPLVLQRWPQDGTLPVLILPNPRSPSKYIVLNSGHTFHEPDFKGTNALLFPRLGDYSLIHAPTNSVVFSRILDVNWR
jgi:dienelactone hydrolase